MTNKDYIESIMLEGETWADVVGYEGLYMISSFGRVVALGRAVVCGRGGTQNRAPKLIAIRQAFSRKGKYLSVLLWKEKTPKTWLTHRLVAIAFIPNPNNYSEIDHINRNTHDNRVGNLRWCNHSMNMLNEETRKVVSSIRKGKDIIGSRKPIVQIKNGVLVERFDGLVSASKCGFSSAEISKVCSGERKSHGGYQWMFADIYDKREYLKRKYNRH